MCLKLLFHITGTKERIAKAAIRAMLAGVKMTFVDASSCREIPALIARNDGGATPKKVPKKNGNRSTPTIGEAMLISQLGRNGVTRRKMM